jgi:hypothetical protein
MKPGEVKELLLAEEIWKPIPGFNGDYEASNLGRIRSYLWGPWRMKTPRIKKMWKNQKGYVRANLNGKQYSVSRCVLMAFRGEPGGNRDASHLDNNRGNNSLENLIWETHSENNSRRALETYRRGEDIGISKLKSGQVAVIYKLRGKRSCRSIAKEYGVARPTIKCIWSGKTWRHVTCKMEK